MEKEARNEMAAEGVDPANITFRYGVAARYIGQMESFETSLDSGKMKNAEDVQRMIDAFETMYSKVYPEGAKFTEAGYSLTAVNLEAIAPNPQPVLRRYKLADELPPDGAVVGSREVYHKNQWLPFKIFEMGELLPGNVLQGPAIIRDPMTTVVVPPDKSMRFDEYKILRYS